MTDKNINLEPVDHAPYCAHLTRMLLSNPPQKAPCDCGFERRKLGDIYADTPYVEKERNVIVTDSKEVPGTVTARILTPIVEEPQTIRFFEKSEIGYLYTMVENSPLNVGKMPDHFKTMPDILQSREKYVHGYPMLVMQRTGDTVELLEDTALVHGNCLIPVKLFDNFGNVVFERILMASHGVVWNSNNVKTKVL